MSFNHPDLRHSVLITWYTLFYKRISWAQGFAINDLMVKIQATTMGINTAKDNAIFNYV